MSVSVLIILIIVSFLASAFFSSTETMFYSVHKTKIRVLAKGKELAAVMIEKFLKKPDNFLIPILIGNNIANVIYASAIATLLKEINSDVSHLESVLVQTLILVIFAEVFPKVIAKNFADELLKIVIYPFKIIAVVLFPFSLVLKLISTVILLPFRKGKEDKELFVSTHEIASLLHENKQHIRRKKHIHHRAKKQNRENKKSKELQEIELNHEFMLNIINMETVKIREIMTHRSSVAGIDISSSIIKLNRLVKQTHYSKIIIFEENLDDIKGVVYFNDLIRKPASIKEAMKEVVFIPESNSIAAVLKKFKEEKLSIAVVLDEFGGCSGIVTMQDILDYIVGKVDDLSLKNQPLGINYIKRTKTLFVDGTVSIDDYNDFLWSLTQKSIYNLPTDKYETINGFAINYLQKIPEEDENFFYKGLTYHIRKAKKNKIENFMIKFSTII